MRIVLRLGLASALLAAAMVGSVGPALAGDTITVTCTNASGRTVLERTVAARAARGVATSLTKFNAYNGRNVTCVAGPGAPRVRGATFQTVTCSNGFERQVNARAAGAITRALNAFNARNRSGITCSLAS